MIDDVRDWVVLYLYDHGPCTMSELSRKLCISLPTLRTHLHLNCPDRYLAKTTIEDGSPVRRWSLAPTMHPPEEETE